MYILPSSAALMACLRHKQWKKEQASRTADVCLSPTVQQPKNGQTCSFSHCLLRQVVSMRVSNVIIVYFRPSVCHFKVEASMSKHDIQKMPGQIGASCHRILVRIQETYRFCKNGGREQKEHNFFGSKENVHIFPSFDPQFSVIPALLIHYA